MNSTITNIVDQVTEAFAANGNPENAHAMSKYMRFKFPFVGIKTTQRRELSKQIWNGWQPLAGKQLEELGLALWQKPEREFHYFAMDTLFRYRKLIKPHQLPLIEHCITHHSWWDTVDFLAANVVGYLCKQYPDLIYKGPEMWVYSDNFWLIRTALLYQLGYKANTDEARLFGYIQKHAHQDEFFIRKAIGWALRQYARTNPEAIRQFVENTPLKPLSRKEALKHLTE